MRKLLMTASVCCFSTMLMAQGMYSVNNNTNFSADFSDLQTAINTVPAGSILIVQGSGTSYGDIVLSKQLVIFGPGYNLANQPHPIGQADHLPAKIDHCDLDSSASGSVLSGLQFERNLSLNYCNNTLIESNYCWDGINWITRTVIRSQKITSHSPLAARQR